MTDGIALTRFADTKDGIIGRLGPWMTLENPWRDNRPNISCIPTGEYQCKRGFYRRGGYETFEVENVPGRSHILFHIGNTDSDTRGCVLIGSRLGVMSGTTAILSSGKAFGEFMAVLDGVDGFTLNISNFDSPLPLAGFD